MSQENVELVRSICAAWERGDYGSVGWAHPEIEFVNADGFFPGARTGIRGMAEGWREWLGAWDDFHQQAIEYREVDDERVLVLFRCSGRGKTSGLDLAQMHPLIAGLFHVREGRVTRFVGYLDHQRALEAVGLSEQDAHADS
jgi:ketosteroid isomerase-like protein